jgi:type I restriction enzyme S subunit
LLANASQVGVPSIAQPVTYLRTIEIPVPPLSEQHAIAHILGTLDDKMELNRRMSETLEAMARAVFKSWFMDFEPVRAKAEGRDPYLSKHIAELFPDSFEDSELGEIPKGWRISTVGEEFNLTMGQSPPGETYNEIGEGIHFFQGRADFGFRYPSHRVFCTAPTRFADSGDALVSVRAPVGDINMALKRCSVGRGVAAIRHKSDSRSYTYYAMHSLAVVFGNFEAEGTVFGCINKEAFHGIKFIAPPPQFILAFEKAAFPIDQTIENNIVQSRTLATLRDALLPKLISGELRVKDAERIVEIV